MLFATHIGEVMRFGFKTKFLLVQAFCLALDETFTLVSDLRGPQQLSRFGLRCLAGGTGGAFARFPKGLLLPLPQLGFIEGKESLVPSALLFHCRKGNLLRVVLDTLSLLLH